MRNSEKGFTLMEIVAALVILGIVAVPLAKTFMDSFKFQAKSQNETEAMKVAQFIAEQLKDGKNYYGMDAETFSVDDVVRRRSEDITGAMGELTDKYDITITVNSEQKGQDISGNTPTEFAYEIETDGNLYNVNDGDADHTGFSITCSDFVIQTSESDVDANTYDILINNISDSQEATFQIDKRTTAKLNVYTKGEYKVNLQGYPYNRLSRKYTTFEKFHLGQKDGVTSKSEDLYNVTVLVESRTNETVKATMNTAFTIKREAKDNVEGEF